MKFLLFGGNGWIGGMVGTMLREGGHEVVCAEVRAEDAGAAAAVLERERPDRVLCLVGRTHGPGHATIDYLEQPGKLVENVRDNLYAPLVLAHACRARGIHLTYLGTGCIFTYDEEHDATHGFREGDAPNFFGSAYSTVKGFTDRLLPMLFPEVLNARIRMPITDAPHPRNFITKITQYAKICSMPNSMTVLPELLPILIDMSVKRVAGTINLTNPGVISHDKILAMYREIVDPSFAWQNFTYEEQSKVLLSGRSNNRLDTTRLESLYPTAHPIHEAVRAALVAYASVR